MLRDEQISVWEAISDTPSSVVKPPPINPARLPHPNIRTPSNLMDEEERLLQVSFHFSFINIANENLSVSLYHYLNV